MSPSKALIYTDTQQDASSPSAKATNDKTRNEANSRPASSASGLREINVNISADASQREPSTTQSRAPPLKRQHTGERRDAAGLTVEQYSASIGPGSKLSRKALAALAEGRENVPPGMGVLSASVGPGIGMVGSGRKPEEKAVLTSF